MMDIKFSDFEDNDRGRQLAEMTKADYWEVQADMWHQNYKEATNEIERLREALRFYAEWGIDAPAVDAIIEKDRGDIARSALQQKERK